MKDRIDDKISQIEQYLEDLYQIVPETFEEYNNDFKTKAACERFFEKIVEASVDLAFLIIRYKKFKMPEDDESSFIILFQNNIIINELSNKLRDAKGMRNVIVHEYGEIDDNKVFYSIREELENDIKDFIKSVEKNLK